MQLVRSQCACVRAATSSFSSLASLSSLLVSATICFWRSMLSARRRFSVITGSYSSARRTRILAVLETADARATACPLPNPDTATADRHAGQQASARRPASSIQPQACGAPDPSIRNARPASCMCAVSGITCMACLNSCLSQSSPCEPTARSRRPCAPRSQKACPWSSCPLLSSDPSAIFSRSAHSLAISCLRPSAVDRQAHSRSVVVLLLPGVGACVAAHLRSRSRRRRQWKRS